MKYAISCFYFRNTRFLISFVWKRQRTCQTISKITPFNLLPCNIEQSGKIATKMKIIFLQKLKNKNNIITRAICFYYFCYGYTLNVKTNSLACELPHTTHTYIRVAIRHIQSRKIKSKFPLKFADNVFFKKRRQSLDCNMCRSEGTREEIHWYRRAYAIVLHVKVSKRR